MFVDDTGAVFHIYRHHLPILIHPLYICMVCIHLCVEFDHYSNHLSDVNSVYVCGPSIVLMTFTR